MTKSQSSPIATNRSSVASEKTHTKKYMFLLLSHSQFAVPLVNVREVLGLGQISPLPNMPSFFAGLINLRGKVVSAVDLRKSLHFITEGMEQDQCSKRPCVIITEVEGRLFGAIVDDVLEVRVIKETEVDHNVDELSQREMFDGVIKCGETGLAPILNLNNALRINELISISDQIAA